MNYQDYDGLGLAQLIKNKELTPLELTELAIQEIEKYNPKLNAVIHKMYEEGRRVAQSSDLPDGLYKGVPLLIKDLLLTYKGQPYAMGNKALKNKYIAKEDHELMKRFKAAGLVTLGKTNTPEFGLTGYTEPEAFGPTRTPWDLTRTSGGSSGGAGAAVAAGMTPVASGGDGGGSIRIPASCCGVFGLKPTRGRTPSAPYGQNWQGAAMQHVLTRSVRDSAALLDITNGDAPGAPYVIPTPEGSYLEATKTAPRKLKIAYSTNSPIGSEVAQPCKDAVMDAVQLLQVLGHDVVEVMPEYDGMKLAMSYMTMYFAEVAAAIEKVGEMLGRKLTPRDVETTTWTIGLLGRSHHSGELVKALEYWHKVGRVMGQFHQVYDLYLTPTIAVLPPKIGALKSTPQEVRLMKIVNALGLGKLLRKTGTIEEIAYKNFSSMPFTQVANLTGQPAMSVPLYWTDENLPVGVQFIAPFGDEMTLYKLAGQLERARPWFDKRPDLKAIIG